MIWIGEYPSVFRGKRSKQGFILGVMKNFITNNQCIIIFCLQKLSFGCPATQGSGWRRNPGLCYVAPSGHGIMEISN